MKCVRKDRSCFCYSLEYGAVIIGIISMMSSAIGLLCEVGMLYEWDRGISDNFEDKRMKKCKIWVSFFFILILYNKKIFTLFFSCASCFDNQYCFKWCLLDIFYSFTQRNQRGKTWNSKFTHHLENEFTNFHRIQGIKYGHG